MNAVDRLTECPVDGCEICHPRNLLMCRSHWYSVPKHLREALWDAFRHHGVISEEYLDARRAAIDAATQRDTQATVAQSDKED